jgi:hypothetical protein
MPSPVLLQALHRPGMQVGAFALLDCLGFKGIWNRGVDPNDIVSFLEKTQAEAEALPLRKLVALHSKNVVRVSIAFVSDTVAVSASIPTDNKVPDWIKGFLVHTVSHLSLDLVTRFAFEAPKCLALRGCIGYGPHLVQNSFFLGPAVDEVATLHEVGEGAFVWLEPKAEVLLQALLTELPKIFQSQIPSARELLLPAADRVMTGLATYSQLNPDDVLPIVQWWKVLPDPEREKCASLVLNQALSYWRTDDFVKFYEMPVKNGGTLRVTQLNPLFRANAAEVEKKAQLILSTFDSSALDVMIKKKNTGDFLAIAGEHRKDADRVVKTRMHQIREQLTALGCKTF